MTAIEVLSPDNKLAGAGRKSYLKKRDEFYEGGANLVGNHGDARPDQPGRFWSGEFFRQGEIDLPKLHRGAFGDLGGAFIINPEADEADRDYVQAVNERWTGIKEPHFRRCAVRAEIVLQCIQLGLINHLILDSDCADELHKMAR